MFSLQHYRTHFSPETWAPFDNKEPALSWAIGFFDLEYSPSCVVIHGARYGKLAWWEPKAVHRWDIVGFLRTRLIVEALADLLFFLRRIVYQILEGLDREESTTSTTWAELAHLGFKESDEIAYWSKNTNQPFTSLPLFDIEALLSQAKPRFDESSDHIWLLQTQPSYMRSYIQLLNQYQILKESSRAKFYELILHEIFNDVQILEN